MEEAFWQLLAEKPYREMTIAAISRLAKVNHNTFYYYFDSLDDMAIKLLDSNMLIDLPARIFTAFTAGQLEANLVTSDPEVLRRFKRISLLAGPHGASWQKDILKQRVTSLWLQTLGLSEAELMDKDKALLTFIISGLLAMVGEYGQNGDPALFGHIIQSDLGHGVLATVTKISARS
jgi:AcrR family transcriptional regulator